MKIMTQDEKEIMDAAMNGDPAVIQPTGRIAVSTLKEIHGFDVSTYSVMEFTVAIDALKAARIAKLQRHLGRDRGF